MDKNKLEKFKNILEEQQIKIEAKLASIAQKDPKMKGDYDTRFPQFEAQSTDEEALEVATYESTLPIEHALEIKLVEVKKALERIKDGIYGRCKNCNEDIDEKRLEALPESDICLKCQK